MDFRRVQRRLRERSERRDREREQLVALTAHAAANQPIYLDPVEYADKVLGVTLTPQQCAIVRALRESPWMVAVDSGNNQGKTFVAAVVVNWWFDTFRDDCAIITTASNYEQVSAVLWGHVRILRERAGLPGFEMRAKSPELYDGPNHTAKGLSTDRPERLKGRHFKYMLFVIDEGVGVSQWVFDAIRTMFQEGGNHAWLCLCNPTDTTSAMWAEEQKTGLDEQPVWRVFTLSAVDHPNVIADLHERGERIFRRVPPQPRPRVPNAVTLSQLEAWIASGADPIPASDANATDLQWPPEWWRLQYTPDAAPQWFRPGAECEAVALGRWPLQNAGSVWSQAAWDAACVRRGSLTDDGFPWQPGMGQPYFPGEVIGNGEVPWLPVISCDPARKGLNKTAIMVRAGPHALAFEQHSGWEAPRTVGRLKELAREWAEWATARRHVHAAPITPQQIRVVVDSDGLGAYGVIDWSNPGWQNEFTFVPLGASSPAIDPTRYVNKRSELWFNSVGLARVGQMDLSRLPRKALALLRQQAMAPEWKFDGLGHKVVEEKAHMQERGVVSPDAMDALNLNYHPSASGMEIELLPGKGLKPVVADDPAATQGWDESDARGDLDDRPAHHRQRRV